MEIITNVWIIVNHSDSLVCSRFFLTKKSAEEFIHQCLWPNGCQIKELVSWPAEINS